MAPHAVIIPADGPGHVNPLVELGDRLEQRYGFLVTVLLLPRTVDNQGFSLKRDHPRLRFVEVPVPVHLRLGNELEVMDSMHEVVEEVVRELDPPATVMLSDAFIGCTQDIADTLGIPRVFFFAASTACDIVCANVFELKDRGYIPVKKNWEDDSVIDCLAGLPGIRRKDLPLCFYDDSFVIDVLGKACKRRPEAFCVLSNSFAELEPVAINAMRERRKYFTVGPLLSPALLQDGQLPRDGLRDNEEELGCLEWLDAQPPKSILYMAFGSAAFMSYQQVEEIVKALEASKQGFLWTFRTRRNFVVDAPDNQAVENLVERARAIGHGKVVSWAPQLHVLRHPALVGFVTHCGWNSLMEAVTAGVPMLAWPCLSEQNMNSRRMVEEWKVAAEVNNHGQDDPGAPVVGAAKLEKLVMEINGEKGEEMRKNVLQLREALRRAHKPGGSAWESLREFAECFLV